MPIDWIFQVYIMLVLLLMLVIFRCWCRSWSRFEDKSFQEGEDYAILEAPKKVLDLLELPPGPITRGRSKSVKEAFHELVMSIPRSSTNMIMMDIQVQDIEICNTMQLQGWRLHEGERPPHGHRALVRIIILGKSRNIEITKPHGSMHGSASFVWKLRLYSKIHRA